MNLTPTEELILRVAKEMFGVSVGEDVLTTQNGDQLGDLLITHGLLTDDEFEQVLRRVYRTAPGRDGGNKNGKTIPTTASSAFPIAPTPRAPINEDQILIGEFMVRMTEVLDRLTRVLERLADNGVVHTDPNYPHDADTAVNLRAVDRDEEGPVEDGQRTQAAPASLVTRDAEVPDFGSFFEDDEEDLTIRGDRQELEGEGEGQAPGD